MVLNTSTGLVSPQFHCKFDDFFETTRFNQAEASTAAPWRKQASLKPDNVETNVMQPSDLSEAPIGSASESSSESTSLPSAETERAADQSARPSSTRAPLNNLPTANEGASSSSSSNSGGVSARGRRRTLSHRMAQSIEQRDFYGERDMHYMASCAVAPTTSNHDAFHDWHLDLQDRMRHPIAFHAEMMGDIMYLNQALKQHDADEFVKAVVKEVDGHIKAKRWKVIKRDEVPEGHVPLPSVWAMRRKRDLTTNEVTKHKARLNLHGGKQQFGENYFDTYAQWLPGLQSD